MVRAASSLPEPGAPVIITRALVAAMRSISGAQLHDRGGVADDPARLHRLRLQLLDLAFQPRSFERAIRHEHEPIGLEGLLDEVVGAAPDRGYRRFDIAMAARS